MKTITFQIPDMQSSHCQARVSNALKMVSGIRIENQEAGLITLSLEEQTSEDSIVKAIGQAGYTVEKMH